MRPMNLGVALLEEWMRRYYYSADIDLGSSGVESYSLGEIRALLEISSQQLDDVRFNDGHSLGGHALRAAIATRYGAPGPEYVMVTHGSNEALFLAMHALLRAGDEVVAQAPAYQQLLATAEALGCEVRRWRLRVEERFEPDLDALRSLITPRTRLLVVNLPHNPTGASVSPDDARRLVEIAASVGAWLVWDIAFGDLCYSSATPFPGHLGYERMIRVGTMSKAYGLAGLRVGWCIAPPSTLQVCTEIRDFTTLHLSPLIELIAQMAIEHAERLIAPRLRQALENASILRQWALQHAETFELVEPKGGVCAFPRLKNFSNTDEICHALGRHGVLLVPGSCFHMPEFVRLGFGGPNPQFREGLVRLAGLLEKPQARGGSCLTVSRRRGWM